MGIGEFIENYLSDSYLNTIISSINNDELYNNSNDKLFQKDFSINGISGSLISVLICSINKISNKTQIIIANDRLEAELIYSDIYDINKKYSLSDNQSETNKNNPLLFISTEDSSKNNFLNQNKSELIKNTNQLLRSEVINSIIHNDNKPLQVITYPEAISEKIPNLIDLKTNVIKLFKNDNIDLTKFSEKILELKFEKVETVMQPGEFSIRGGIIDIFSFANQEPYRIELWGNEIESIRLFNPETQISTQQLDKAIITNNISNNKDQNKESFFNLFSKNSILWLKNSDSLKARFKELSENDKSFKYDKFLKSIEHFQKINTNIKHKTSTNGENSIWNYQSESQIPFNSNFDILAKNLEQYQNKDYKFILVGEHYKSTEKIKTILESKIQNLDINTLKLGLSKGFIDHHNKIVCYTDHQILGRFYQHKTNKRYNSKEAITLKQLYNLKTGDYIVHADHGIGKFAGIQKSKINDHEQELIRLVYKNNDIVYLNIHNLHKIVKYNGKEGAEPALHKLGSLAWKTKKQTIKKKVKDIADDLIKLYSERKNSKGFSFKPDDTMQIALETSFMYEDTPDQALASKAVKEDMEKPYPMDRLICGDVGFGKTEIAMRAAFKAVNSGKQVAVLVPTTILTMQHFRSFSKRLENFPVTVDYINRFKSSKQIKELLEDLEKGKLDIIIGTHALVGKKVKFKDLGLLIIDEEQKFGVATKEQIKKLKVNIDILTLTATPIPRTLHFSLMGARDLSVIATPPTNRQPIETFIINFKKEIITEAIKKELDRNGQVFFVHNRVQNIEGIAEMIRDEIPNSRVGVAHGQMEGKLLESQMLKFIEGEYDILVSTNIVESGLDIPNANTILINQAQNFGLSDLHQMRGRVGRSNKKAYCYLIVPPISTISADARKRIAALEEFNDIGDGFKVAMKDLDIRGAGDLLGAQQSGFIADIGYEMYHQILDEAVNELKETKYKGLFEQKIELSKKDCIIETDIEVLIPEEYVSSQSERINLYMKIDKLKNIKELNQLKLNLQDRFGQIPEKVERLFQIIQLRWVAQKLGIDKLKLKKENLVVYIKKDSSNNNLFLDKIIEEIQINPQLYYIQQAENECIITIKNITSLNNANIALNKIISY